MCKTESWKYDTLMFSEVNYIVINWFQGILTLKIICNIYLVILFG